MSNDTLHLGLASEGLPIGTLMPIMSSESIVTEGKQVWLRSGSTTKAESVDSEIEPILTAELISSQQIEFPVPQTARVDWVEEQLDGSWLVYDYNAATVHHIKDNTILKSSVALTSSIGKPISFCSDESYIYFVIPRYNNSKEGMRAVKLRKTDMSIVLDTVLLEGVQESQTPYVTLVRYNDVVLMIGNSKCLITDTNFNVIHYYSTFYSSQTLVPYIDGTFIVKTSGARGQQLKFTEDYSSYTVVSDALVDGARGYNYHTQKAIDADGPNNSNLVSYRVYDLFEGITTIDSWEHEETGQNYYVRIT